MDKKHYWILTEHYKVILLLIFAIISIKHGQAEEIQIENFIYNVNDHTAEATLVGLSPEAPVEFSVIEIPESINVNEKNYRVVGIDEYVFSERTFGELSLPYTLEFINEGAFYKAKYSKNQHLNLPQNIRYIGKKAFYGVEIVGDLIIPSSIERIEDYAFYKSQSSYSFSTGRLILPSNLKSIGKYAFTGRRFNGGLDIPETIETIGEYSFDNCEFSGNLVLPSSLERIEKNTFSFNNFTNISFPSSLKCINDSAFYWGGLTGELILPGSLKEIGSYAFAKQNITKIVLPNSITTIGEGAFEGNNKLISLILPENITRIEASTFSGCKSLIGPINWPNSLEFIGDGAFSNCSSLTGALILPPELNIIGKHAFSGAKYTSILFPSNLKRIDDYAFSTCPFTEIDLPSSIEYLGDVSLNSSSLNKIICRPLIPPTISKFHPFYTFTPKTAILEVPESSLALYQSTPYWKDFINIKGFQEEIPVSEITIDPKTISLFVGETQILNITILPDNAKDKTIMWSVSNPIIASIDESGLIKALNVGTTSVTATSSNGLSAECEVTVMETSVSGIVIDKETMGISGDDLEMLVGETKTIMVIVEPETATDKSLTFESSNPDVASVDEDGKVTALSLGSTTINITAKSGVSASLNVRVVPTLAGAISLNRNTATLKATETLLLEATVLPETTTDKSVFWTSSDSTVATVDENGLVAAVNVGKAIITATTTNGLKAECEVTVTETEVSGIIIDKGAMGIEGDDLEMLVGETKTIMVTVEPETATDKSLTFESSNPEVASVDKEGKITALSLGSTKITITAKSGVSVSLNVRVVSTLAGAISLNRNTATLKATETLQLEATVLPETTTDKSVFWTSSDSTVATVDENGLVTTVNVGKATITATTTNGLKAECEVTVIETEASSIVIDKEAMGIEGDDLEMLVGETKTIMVTVEPETTTDKSLTFESSNPDVASVDDDGKITALSLGSTTITITAKSGISASLNVRVVSTLAGAISLNRNTATLKATETMLLEATVLPETTTDKSVFWSSSDSSIAKVDGNGLVTAVNVGKATITATTTNGLKAECEVTVVETEATGIVIDKDSMGIEGDDLEMLVGETKTIMVTVEPETATDKSLTFKSSNPDVASVVEEGTIIAISPGRSTVTITAKSGVSTSINVIVTSPIIPVDPVEPVTITVSSQKVREGSLLILAADQPQGGYENGWRWNWLADGEIISDELEFEYTPEMYPGEEQSTETINFTFKATNSNPDGEVFSLIDESTNVTVYRRPSTPKQLLRKGDGTSNTFVTMADKTDKRLQALGYFFVYGYEDIKGDNHILGTTPLRYFHTTRDIYINSNNNFWVYSSWTYPDGSIVTSGKRYLNGLVDEDFDGSSFNINDTRSIDGSNPDNWIKLTAKGIEINVANESDTKIELFDMQGHILKHLIVNGGDNFSLTIGNETLSKGVYIVRVASEKHSVTRKTIIK